MRRVLALPAALALAGACGGSSSPASAPKTEGPPPNFVAKIGGPPKLLPDLSLPRFSFGHDAGEQRFLVDRLRVVEREDGSMLRATQLLPPNGMNALPLPTRLGGGTIFYGRSGTATRIWRAPSWLADLEPIVTVPDDAREIVPGFDRLYVRLARGSLIAIDAADGSPRSLAPLPPATGYGPMVFADGWRAIVDTDLRGVLATFDAGATWRKVGIGERVNAMSLRNGDPVVSVQGGEYLVDAKGNVTFVTGQRDQARDASLESPKRAQGPLGRHALRAAIEDGYPETDTTAVVARGGALVRVSLADGAVLATANEAYPERDARCHGVRVGRGWGFICGERDGATTIYEATSPLTARAVLKFKKPRFVSASGNGALVVRGACDDDDDPGGDARSYCIRDVSGDTHEIRVKGDLGVERVVALADGRVVVLVPPRGASSGQITVLSGATGTSAPLKLPTEPHAAARDLRRGMWLEGFEEREHGAIGGWVEAGGPTIGVRVALDGTVKAGELRDDATSFVMSGRFAIATTDADRAAETSDGGFTWNEFDMPRRPDEEKAPERSCGPIGCRLQGYLRVGWGAPSKEEQDEPPEPLVPPPAALKAPRVLSYRCDLDNNVTPPLPEKAARAPQPPPPRYRGRRAGFGYGGYGYNPSPTPTGWTAFRNTAPPALDKDEVGYDVGTYQSVVNLHVYGWGKHGADWTKAGRWLVRFDDRFDPAGGLRSSAISASPWADENAAYMAITGGYGAPWFGMLDPSGRAMLAESCMGICQLWSVVDGQPLLPVRESHGAPVYQYANGPGSAVRIGETWYFTRPSPTFDGLELWRADLGVARVLTTWPRAGDLWRTGALENPILVRRAESSGLGLLVQSTPERGERTGMWDVLPIDPDTGELGDAVALVRRSFDRVPLDRCREGQDGWIVDTNMATTPVIGLVGAMAPLDPTIDFRLLLEPGSACVVAMAGRIQGVLVKGKPEPQTDAKSAREEGISFAATEQGAGRRWNFKCRRHRGLMEP